MTIVNAKHHLFCARGVSKNESTQHHEPFLSVLLSHVGKECLILCGSRSVWQDLWYVSIFLVMKDVVCGWGQSSVVHILVVWNAVL